MKRIGTLTRDDHTAGVMRHYYANIAEGMSQDEAMTKAGQQWRSQIEMQGSKEMSAVRKFLGIKDN